MLGMVWVVAPRALRLTFLGRPLFLHSASRQLSPSPSDTQRAQGRSVSQAVCDSLHSAQARFTFGRFVDVPPPELPAGVDDPSIEGDGEFLFLIDVEAPLSSDTSIFLSFYYLHPPSFFDLYLVLTGCTYLGANGRGSSR
jgi:hypothetical protein